MIIQHGLTDNFMNIEGNVGLTVALSTDNTGQLTYFPGLPDDVD